jgi:hypothetical protein
MEQDQMEMAQKQVDKWETVEEKNHKNFKEEGAKEMVLTDKASEEEAKVENFKTMSK